MCSWVPLSRNNFFQNRLMKIRSLSETMLRGMPWSFPTISMKKDATVSEVWFGVNMPKCIPFEKWSTTTKIVLCPRYSGNPTIKSNQRSSHCRRGTGKGQRSLAGLRASYLVCWQSKRMVMNCCTSLWMPDHTEFSLILAMVLAIPIWPTVEDE